MAKNSETEISFCRVARVSAETRAFGVASISLGLLDLTEALVGFFRFDFLRVAAAVLAALPRLLLFPVVAVWAFLAFLGNATLSTPVGDRIPGDVRLGAGEDSS